MLTLIKFTTFGSCTLCGNFGPGDTLRCKPDMARHLVEQARCAQYAEESPPDNPPAPAPAAPRTPRPRRKAE